MRIRSIVVSVALAVSVTGGATAAHADSVIRQAPPCFYEDGSGQTLCVWDARARGNHRGQSLIEDNDGPDNFIPVSHRHAHRLIARWRAHHCVHVTRTQLACWGWNRG